MINFSELNTKQVPVAVVGLGYVGLPLAVSLAKKFAVIGFDISEGRVTELRKGHDRTGEVTDADLAASSVQFSSDPSDLALAGVVIVAVPTPIDKYKRPDLTPVVKASETVGRNLRKGAVVVYESTVYPGVTEDVCCRILERESGLQYGRDFTLGYSPERINPGDKKNTLENIVKVVAGSDQDSLELLAQVYGSVIRAGIHKASSIKVAEAAKVIENTQRDLNIALMNELALIFDLMNIDTHEVLAAARTKWNFLPFTPGLVGGHCIGVDPYYLTFKAQELGYHPQVILAGRRINDGMGKYVAESAVKLLIKSDHRVKGARVGIMGFTFKEDVPDLRNTRVIDVINELREYEVEVLVHDPLADPEEAREEYGLRLNSFEELNNLDALIICVAHKEYKLFTPEKLRSCFAPATSSGQPVILDIKGLWDAESAAGFVYWRL